MNFLLVVIAIPIGLWFTTLMVEGIVEIVKECIHARKRNQ
jgi:hypothetical protein